MHMTSLMKISLPSQINLNQPKAMSNIYECLKSVDVRKQWQLKTVKALGQPTRVAVLGLARGLNLFIIFK